MGNMRHAGRPGGPHPGGPGGPRPGRPAGGAHRGPGYPPPRRRRGGGCLMTLLTFLVTVGILATIIVGIL